LFLFLKGIFIKSKNTLPVGIKMPLFLYVKEGLFLYGVTQKIS